MAALFVATVLAGFVPDSLAKISAIQAGARPPFPVIMHIHAVLMGSWLLLLLTQATLMATGRSTWHKQLGVLSFGLIPAMIVAGFMLAAVSLRMALSAFDATKSLPPSVAGVVPVDLLTNLLMFQIRVGLMFPVCVGIALWARTRDAGLHKRMMFLATALPIPAAINRMEWMPTTLPSDPSALGLYTLLVISPMFAWDIYRLRRVHKAYFIWLAMFVPTTIVIHVLWGSPWWFATARHLVGAS